MVGRGQSFYHIRQFQFIWRWRASVDWGRRRWVRKVELTVVGVDWVGELELTRVDEVQLTGVGVDWSR